MTTLTFRGTGDSQGVPRIYCDCQVCEEARSSNGGLNRRYRSALQMDDPETGTIWIDCGPDWGKQMEAAGKRSIDCLLITHAHFDHIGGLVDWYDVCRWTQKKGVAYSPSEVIKEIEQRLPWLASHISFRPFDEPIRLGAWSMRSWRVNHGKNGYSYAFRFDNTRSGYAWVYCSDAIGLSEEQQRPLMDVDLLVLGTSFYQELYPYETRSVYDVTEAIKLIELWRPKRTILTHMSHDIDIKRDYSLPDRMVFAETGMKVHI